jgi:GT2 family glycosyltransferase
MPLVSIITPSYNQSAYLEQTIQSVLAQEYQPLEYLIVDGGSTDGSLEIIQKYASRLAWWISERDTGQADAINKGLQRARGEIVAWLNSDDLYLPGAVSQAVAAFQAGPGAGLVFGDAVSIDASGRQLNHLSFGDWGLEELACFRIICQPAVFMRREVLEQVGLLDPSYHYLLDHQLWLRIAQAAPVRHVPQVWAAARHHPGAKNVAQPAGFGQEALRILAWMEAQPGLAAYLSANRRRVEAGAYRLNARYLLDGEQPGPALRAYGRALLRSPGFTLQHWHRMLYALLSLAGGKGLAELYYRLRRKGSV